MNYIYAIEAVGTDYVKIGTTTDLPQRISNLSTGCPHDARYAGRWAGDREVETMIHEELATYRRRGEWFDMGAERAVWEITRIVQHQPFSDREIQYLERLDLLEANAGETIPHQEDMIRRYEGLFDQLQEAACENEQQLRDALSENETKDRRIRELEFRIAACNSHEPVSLSSWRTRGAAFINRAIALIY